jgi:RAD50-interacting protein 1
MSIDEVKDRTSSVVGTDGDGGLLFDETIAAYVARRRRAQEFLSEAIVESNRKSFRPYVSKTQWTTIVEDFTAGRSSQNL